MRVNVLWTLFGNTLYGLSQCIMLIALAKLGTPDLVGQFALAFAITAPVIMAANLNLRTIIATDAGAAYAFGDYLALRLSCLAGANAIILGVVALLYRDTLGMVILMVAMAKSIEATSDVFVGLMQQHERMDWVSQSFGLKAAASLIGLVGGLCLGGTLFMGVTCLMGAWGAVLLGYDMRRGLRLARAGGHTLVPMWRWRDQRRLFGLTLPLGLTTLLASLQTNVPRLFVERYLGTQELGLFAASTYLMIAGARVMTSLGEAASPRLGALAARGEAARFGRLVVQLLAVMFVVAVLAIGAAALYGREIMSLLYTAEYADQPNVLIVVLVAAALGYGAVLLQYALTAARILNLLPVVMAGSIAITVAGCVALVPRWGSLGAAAAMCGGSMFQLFSNAVATRVAVHRLGGGAERRGCVTRHSIAGRRLEAAK